MLKYRAWFLWSCSVVLKRLSGRIPYYKPCAECAAPDREGLHQLFHACGVWRLSESAPGEIPKGNSNICSFAPQHFSVISLLLTHTPPMLKKGYGYVLYLRMPLIYYQLLKYSNFGMLSSVLRCRRLSWSVRGHHSSGPSWLWRAESYQKCPNVSPQSSVICPDLVVPNCDTPTPLEIYKFSVREFWTL